jgi:hypothetical protein
MACHDASGLFAPADAALDDVAARVSLGVEGERSPRIATEGFEFFRNDRLNALLPQPVANSRHGVTFVPTARFWAPKFRQRPLSAVEQKTCRTIN